LWLKGKIESQKTGDNEKTVGKRKTQGSEKW
jgi:hypothetical protein